MVRIGLIFLPLFGLGCLGPGVEIMPMPEEDKIKVYSKNFEVVWNAIVDTITEMEIPIKTIDKESGVIITDFVRFHPLYFGKSVLREGKTMGENTREGRYMVNATVRPESDSTRVKLNIHTERLSTDRSGIFVESFPSWKSQPSNGVIEGIIFQKIDSKLSGG